MAVIRDAAATYTFKYPDGYSRQCDDVYHADKRVYLTGTTDHYQGALRNGKPHGQGECWYFNRQHYTGDWQLGEWHGQGVWTMHNGSVYEGGFARGEPHGNGCMTIDCAQVFDGQWDRGIFREEPSETTKAQHALEREMIWIREGKRGFLSNHSPCPQRLSRYERQQHDGHQLRRTRSASCLLDDE
jgi:hypothetical protein